MSIQLTTIYCPIYHCRPVSVSDYVFITTPGWHSRRCGKAKLYHKITAIGAVNNYSNNHCPIVTTELVVWTHTFNDVGLFRGLEWLTDGDNSNQLQHEAVCVCVGGGGGLMLQLGLYPLRKLSRAELFSILQAKRSDAETVNYMNSRSFWILCPCCLCGF
jgi:hypothetical protein